MLNRQTTIAALTVAASLLLGACGKQEASTAPDENTASDATMAAPAMDQQALTYPPRTPSPALAAVFFITPADGDTVSSPVHIEFGLDGMDVVPAGVAEPSSGHHHLLVDTGLPDLGLPIPADEHHIHFGDGSTSTDLALEPGVHTLQLLLGDHLHIPHDPPVMSETITITVE